MKKYLFLLLWLPLTLAAQELPLVDRIDTKKGPLTIEPVVHGSLGLIWNGRSIWVDPYGGAEAYEELPTPDIILITDIHGDHLDLNTLQAINTSKARIVAPPAVVDKLPEPLKAKSLVLQNGDSTLLFSVGIKAMPMYNLPETADSRHPKGRGNGYLLELGGKQVYISGDTEDIPEMRALEGVDVAFVSMNLPYTMGIDQAASAVLDFKPKIVFPYHYRGQEGKSDVQKFKQMVNAKNKKIDVRLRDWYPNKE